MKALFLIFLALISLTTSAQTEIHETGGQVGISTTTPSAKLDVNGSFHVSNGSTLDGTTYIGGNLYVTQDAFYSPHWSGWTTGVEIGHYGYAEQFMCANFASSAVTVGYSLYSGGRHGLTSAANVDLNFWTRQNQALLFGTDNKQRLEIASNGDVWIGENVAYRNREGSNGSWPVNWVHSTPTLHVNGFIEAKKIKITQLNWPDYVFSKTYKLRSIASLDSYINSNGHLPDVPSAREVEKNGVDLAKTQAMLLRKIEELTLYVLKQQKEIEKLKRGKR